MDIKCGDKYLVDVHGFIMCKGVSQGEYRIEITELKNKYLGRDGALIADFYKPKGKKRIVRHFISDIMLDYDSDYNYTKILKKIL
jgi:hypothetical protein